MKGATAKSAGVSASKVITAGAFSAYITRVISNNHFKITIVTKSTFKTTIIKRAKTMRVFLDS